MVEQLGLKGTAEAFVKAETHLRSRENDFAEEDFPKEMTAKDWKLVIEAEDEDEEEDMLEGEEEELLDEEPEEEGDGEADGPA
eukprot:CAMPEP_0170630116 /NCGR_PEP_ID=MMETSP0224-20130122/33779_1 /TAXON_ID=285029 /ORGANISM="Togula jolla, Strain CCCM 725" /LENGTH=82 /DNA_ID=CAMNT_0010958053 /DNA_START=3 /DNA_END=248 /DNA_ORIENTATION=-